MTFLDALLLGLVQGLTEFLPVSSSGHLVLVEHLLGVSSSDISFEVATHFATLLAVVAFFFPVLTRIFLSPIKIILGLRDEMTARDFSQFVIICVATIPAVVIGLLLRDQIESAFSSARMASVMLLVTSAILFSTLLAKPKGKHVTLKSGFFIGCAQALAILPGISRSGSTIVAGLFSGVSRQEAFSFSFILSMPAIIGATLLTGIDAIETGLSFEISSYVIAMAVAFVSGYFALLLLQKMVISGKIYLFGIYTLIAGILGIVFIK